MPFSLVATCLLLILSTTLNATPPPADPVGYWAFDAADIDGSTVAEKSGSGATCQILEATLGSGRVGEALALDGDADGITINGLDIASKQISVSMWIRRDSSVGARRLLNFCTTQLTGNRDVDTYFSKTTQVGFSGTELFVHSGKEGRADYNQPLVDPGIINGRWTHLVITWDTAAKSSNVQIYADGKLRVKADLDTARDVEIKVRAIFVGHINDPDSLKQVFHGAIDELAVYDRVLSAEEIAAYHLAVNEAHGAEAVIPFGQVIEIKSKAVEGPPYVPEPLFSGQRKLIRCASELCSRLLHSPSIAATDLPAKVKIWQDTGLDGMIFSMATHNPPVPVRGTNMTGQWWGLEKRHYEEFEPEIKAFQSVEDWGRLTDNFLWSSYAVWWDGPRTRCQNWFNDADWEILLHNIGLHARIAKECGFVGILFDVEQYRGHHANGTWHIPFSYPVYREGSYKLDGEESPRPFNEVQAQVRQRGLQYARTVCAAFPGARILVLPGLYEWTARLGNGPLEHNHNGLFPAFLDGMLLGLDKNAMMIAGNELTYTKTDYRPIANVRKMYDDAIEDLCSVGALKHKLSFASGIWADTGNWSDTDVTVNARDYNNHRRALQHAFMVSGEYAWLYGERSFFLTTEPTDVMKGYFQANIDAHTFDGPPPREKPKE